MIARDVQELAAYLRKCFDYGRATMCAPVAHHISRDESDRSPFDQGVNHDSISVPPWNRHQVCHQLDVLRLPAARAPLLQASAPPRVLRCLLPFHHEPSANLPRDPSRHRREQFLVLRYEDLMAMDAAATLRLLSRFTGLDASTCRWLRTVTLGH